MYKKIVQVGTKLHVYEYQYRPFKNNLARERYAPRRKRNSERRPDNIAFLRKKFTQLVSTNLSFSYFTAFLTLTYASVVDVSAGNAGFTKFQRVFSKKFPQVQYVCVPEFQKRGSIHYHLLLFNFPEDLVLSERNTRFLAKMWGNGFVDIVSTDNSPKLAFYLAKYMSKNLSDDRLNGKKAYFCSRNVLRPCDIKTDLQLDYLQKEWSVDINTLTPVYSKKYNTMWLGQCDYNVYKLN